MITELNKQKIKKALNEGCFIDVNRGLENGIDSYHQLGKNYILVGRFNNPYDDPDSDNYREITLEEACEEIGNYFTINPPTY